MMREKEKASTEIFILPFLTISSCHVGSFLALDEANEQEENVKEKEILNGKEIL